MVWNTPGNGSPDRKHGAQQGGGQRQGSGWWRFVLQPKSSGEGVIRRWIIFVAVLIVCASSLHIVEEQQQGVVLRFGRFTSLIPPGVAVTWPWPIESVIKISPSALKTYRAELSVLTSDENIVYATVNVQYQIDDPRKYLFVCRDADQILEQATQSIVREQVGHSSWSRLLKNRSLLAATAKEHLQSALQAYQTGLVVSDLTFVETRPPDQVKAAFDAVDQAAQVREHAISQAHAYAADVVPRARGRAEGIKMRAEADKLAVIAHAQGDVERFSLLAERYKAAPLVTRQQLWLAAIEDALQHNQKIISHDDRNPIALTLPAVASPPPLAIPQVDPQPPIQDKPSGQERSNESLMAPPPSAEPVRNPERQPRTSGH